MVKNDENLSRQAIKEKKERQKEQILSGIIDNESKTYTFEKSVTLGGVKRNGSFTAKYMGVADRLRIGTIRAKLLDGAPSQSVDTLTDDIAYMIAYLQVALTKTPSWWSFDMLDDISDLRELYMEVYNFVQSFRLSNESNTNAGDSSNTSSKENVEN